MISVSLSPRPNADGLEQRAGDRALHLHRSVSGIAVVPGGSNSDDRWSEPARHRYRSRRRRQHGNGIGLGEPRSGAPALHASVARGRHTWCSLRRRDPGTATDALSGVATAACNATPATFAAGIVECAPPLSPGINAIQSIVTDNAGNSAVGVDAHAGLPARADRDAHRAGNLSYLNITPTTVSGTVDDPTATVIVNSIPAAVVNGSFSLALPLAEGPEHHHRHGDDARGRRRHGQPRGHARHDAAARHRHLAAGSVRDDRRARSPSPASSTTSSSAR